MAIAGESSSSAASIPPSDKPVVVRVKRKITQTPLDAFWLEINERPLKRPLLDFEKLSISNSSGKDEFKAKKVFVQHVETVTSAEATVDIVQSFVPTSANAVDGKTKSKQRRHTFKKENRHDQHITKARKKQEELAKNARFEQIWRIRKGNKEEMHEKELRDMCQFYDVVRVDVEEKSNEMQKQEDLSFEDQRLLSSYLPLLREFLPDHAAEIESDMHANMSTKDEFVYDYYTVNDDMKINDEGSNPFPLVQVDDEEYYDGPDESEYDSEDSNAEDNPRNDYPDESEEEEEAEVGEEEEEEGVESKTSDDESEDSSEGERTASRDPDLLHDDDLNYDDFNDSGDDFDYYDDKDHHNDGDDDGEDWRWSYR